MRREADGQTNGGTDRKRIPGAESVDFGGWRREGQGEVGVYLRIAGWTSHTFEIQKCPLMRHCHGELLMHTWLHLGSKFPKRIHEALSHNTDVISTADKSAETSQISGMFPSKHRQKHPVQTSTE